MLDRDDGLHEFLDNLMESYLEKERYDLMIDSLVPLKDSYIRFDHYISIALQGISTKSDLEQKVKQKYPDIFIYLNKPLSKGSSSSVE